MKLTKRLAMQPSSNSLILLALFLGSLGVYALQWKYSLSEGFYNLTGGVSTVGAERILHGELPYSDFWTMYAPGQFYLLASVFAIFGTRLMVEVVAAGLVCAAAACVCYQFVQNLTQKKLAALFCACIFVAATDNTGYFKRLGSYPSAILLILLSLHCLVRYYQTSQLRYLLFAGLATSAAAVFKHDVAAYTAVAIGVGMLAFYFLTTKSPPGHRHAFVVQLLTYGIGTLAIIGPVASYFVWQAGPDIWHDLIVFPTTDFRFARPEFYPSLWPSGLGAAAPIQLLENICNYLIFAMPFLLQCLGLVTIGLAIKRREPVYAAIGVTLWVGFLLHYSAAHIQINTHIITMSVYGAAQGVIFYAMRAKRGWTLRSSLANLLVFAVVVGWLLVLMAKPLYVGWTNWQTATATIEVPKLAGFNLSPEEASNLTALTNYVDSHVPPDQAIYIGMQRHDVVIVGDILSYFMLDRPIATRYHELHPAITDTARVQKEIIGELQSKKVALIVRRERFSKQTLETAKADFLKHLPNVGATDLDEFIQLNYKAVQQFGPYSVWERKPTAVLGQASP